MDALLHHGGKGRCYAHNFGCILSDHRGLFVHTCIVITIQVTKRNSLSLQQGTADSMYFLIRVLR